MNSTIKFGQEFRTVKPAVPSKAAKRKRVLQSDYHDSRLALQCSQTTMASSKLTKLELQIMETFWTRGACSVREVQEDVS